ncbi:MAG: glycosyltransferase [Anaeroplasmataceae bacterium]
MIITFIVDQYGQANNGTTITAKRFAERLVDLGHTVNVICALKDEDDQKVNQYSCGESFIPFVGRLKIVKKLVADQGFMFSKANKKVIIPIIKQSDIVHFLLPFKLEKVAKKLCDKFNIPTTAAFHLQPENITSSIKLKDSRLVNNYLYRKFRKFYDKFDHIHCPSNMIANQLIQHKYKAKLHVISNGVSHEFVKKQVNKPKFLKNKIVLLMIGRLSREKRQDLIINAVKESKFEKDIQIIFAGKGPLKTEYQDLSKTLTNKVIFGFYDKDELLDLINYSDIYVHSSDVEIEAISCIEVITCGLVPIISDSKLSATPQFALNKEINLFEANNYIDLKNKIEFLLENKEIKDQLSKEYIEYAKKYNIDSCVDELLDVFYKQIRLQESRPKL